MAEKSVKKECIHTCDNFGPGITPTNPWRRCKVCEKRYMPNFEDDPPGIP